MSAGILSRLTLLAMGLLFIGGLFATIGAVQLAQAPVVAFDPGSSTVLSGWLIMGLGGLVGLGTWLAAFLGACRLWRWGWVATLLLTSLALGGGAALVWFPLFPFFTALSVQSVIYIPLPALALAFVPLPVLGYSLAERRRALARRPFQQRIR